MRSDNKIIINADDFGYDAAVNKAVLRSFQSILITSASLMVNMPGFDDAVRLIQHHRFISGKIGLHLNLTEGYPLTEEIRSYTKFCDADGRFLPARKKSFFFLSQREQRAVYHEMKAQAKKAQAADIRLAHLDSHDHVHTDWALAPLASRLGREFSIPRIRLTRNMGRQGPYSRQICQEILLRWRLGLHGDQVRTDYFGDIGDMMFLFKKRRLSGKLIEIMVHPLFDEQGALTDGNRQDLRQQLAPILDHAHTICVSSADL